MGNDWQRRIWHSSEVSLVFPWRLNMNLKLPSLCHNSDYLQQFNVLDLLGVTSISPTACRPETIALPEEENYGLLLVFDWGVLGKR